MFLYKKYVNKIVSSFLFTKDLFITFYNIADEDRAHCCDLPHRESIFPFIS